MQSLYLAKALIRLGNSVSVLCYHEFKREVVKEFEEAGCRVELANYPRSITKFRLLINLIKWFRKDPHEVVHIQYIAPAAIVILAARLAGIRKVVATVHQMGTEYGLKEHTLMSVSSCLCSRMIFVSLASQQSWRRTRHLFTPGKPESFNNKVGTIYNCVDFDEIEKIIAKSNDIKLKEELGIKQKFIIGAVSRLRYEKGIDLLLEAFSILIRQNTNIHLVIVGEGPDKSNLHAMAEKLTIIDQITWSGEQTHTRSLQIMNVMDIVVIPSRREGFGLTAIEAMALGKPVVASNTGGLGEIIQDRITSILFPNGDSGILANVVELIRKQPEHFINITTAANYSVRKSFGFEIFMHSISILYNSLFSERNVTS